MSRKAPFLRTGPVRRTLSRIAALAAWLAIIMPLRRTAYRPRKPSDPPDNNGAGDPRTVVVDVSALGTFSSGTPITIDKNTNVDERAGRCKHYSRTEDIGDAPAGTR